MQNIKTGLIWIVVILCFIGPCLAFYSVTLHLYAYGISGSYTELIYVVFGICGLVGIISLLYSTIGKHKTLLNRRVTLYFLLLGVAAYLVAIIDIPTNYFRLSVILFVWIPLLCTAGLIYIFRKRLTQDSE